jgi:hypothetical protein
MRWDFSATIPLAKESVPLWEPIETAMSGLNDDSSEPGSTALEIGDTVAIHRKDTITTEIDLSPYFVNTPEVETQTIGEIIVEDLPIVEVPLLPIPNQTLSADRKTVVITLPVESDLFEYLTISPTPQSLIFQTVNSSLNNPVSLARVSLLQNGAVEQSASLPTLAPQSSSSIALPISGKTLSVATSEFQFSVTYKNTIVSSDITEFSFSLNGLIITQGRISSQLFEDSISIDLTKDFVDSMQVDSVSFTELSLNCNITNELGFSAQLQAHFFNSDSSIVTPFWNSRQSIAVGINDCTASLLDFTLYPIWNDSLQISELSLSFTLYPVKNNQMIDFNSENGIEVSFMLGEQKFKSLSGIFTNGIIEENDAEEWELPDVIAEDIREELSGKLQIVNSSMNSLFVAKFDSTSFIDSLELNISTGFGSAEGITNSVDKLYLFSSIDGGDLNPIYLSADEIINTFPEKLQSKSIVTIPLGTPFHIATADNSLTIPFVLYVDFSIPLHFITTDKVEIVNEIEIVEIPSGATEALNVLESPYATLDITYNNNSSMALRVFGIMCDEENITQLDTLSSEKITPEYINSDTSGIFYPITGGEFQILRVSENDTTLHWTLGPKALLSFANNEKIGMRFRIELPTDADMMIDNVGALEIKSAVHIEGIASSDFMEKIDGE